MKTLIIGMDGAQISTFYRGFTPFIESLINSGNIIELKEDLISRGWAEIFTGKHGIETGALYDRPLINKTIEWSLQFNINNIPGLGKSVLPIWQALNQRGYKVGIMNVPTTFPACNVDGFFVSGGGGGGKVKQEISEDMCYPKSVYQILNKVGYIVDERIGTLIGEKKLYSYRDIFDRFTYKNEKRKESFIELSNKFNVDFGFIVFKSSSVFAELITLPEWNRLQQNARNIDTDLIDNVKTYYKKFDNIIKSLVSNYPNAEIILVSDHSMCETEYLININKYLQDNNYQHITSNIDYISNILSIAKKIIKPLIPFHIRNRLRNDPKMKNIINNKIQFDKIKSKAFCISSGDWGSGIFINDEERFGGAIKKDCIKKLSKQIASQFNCENINIAHRITAVVKHDFDSDSSNFYPDITINNEDGYLVSDLQSQYLSKFPKSNNPITVNTWVNNFKPYCIKGHHPIAVSTKQWQFNSKEKYSDLRFVYNHILSTFK